VGGNASCLTTKLSAAVVCTCILFAPEPNIFCNAPSIPLRIC
jgi:hypothetical protein